MALSEHQTKEALRLATDWLVTTEPPGSDAAREGIADVVGLAMMGDITAADVDELAAIVEQYGRRHKPDPAELHAAVTAAFDHVRAHLK